MIIGLAGHVDHGKSALVTALTGVPTDRAPEARRRGITIDLQAVPFRDATGRPIAALIDVPGHEDFVRTMVAGCSGVRAIVLVVAADDGIMPQTREHLLIAEHLGIERGVAVITKVDLVDADWLEMVTADVSALAARSPITFTAPVPVSAVRGDGLGELRTAIAAIAATASGSSADDLFRLPVDRIFHRAGIGTIVTGTAWSGTVRIGDQVLLLPAGRPARVRSIEVHGDAAGEATGGRRVALGLSGVAHDTIQRGETVVHPGCGWIATTTADARIELGRSFPPGAARQLVVVHAGTAAVAAHMAVREPRTGGPSIVRIRFDRPVVLRGGDRAILRTPSPAVTLGGAEILDPDPPHRSGAAAELASPDIAARLHALVARRRNGLEIGAVPVVLGVKPGVVETVARLAVLHTIAGRVFTAEQWQRVEDAAMGEVRGQDLGGLALETLRRRIAPAAQGDLATAVVDSLAARGSIVVAGDRVTLPGAVRPAGPPESLVDQVVAAIRAEQLRAPGSSELATRLGQRDVVAACRVAEQLGLLVAVERERWVASEALETFAADLADLDRTAAGDGGITVAMVRGRTGLSRKYVIPALEWADRTGLTRRSGDVRHLARRSP